MKRLLIINYSMNKDNPIFGHQVDNVTELKKYYDQIVVLTGDEKFDFQGDGYQIVSYRWEMGHRLESSVRFLICFIRVFLKFKPKTVFSHMTEVQSSLIAPALRILGVKHFLWYAHKSKSVYLRWCHFWLNGIITSTPGSCPIISKKVHAIGQAINPELFPWSERENLSRNRLIHIGRIDPSKKIENIIESFLIFYKADPDAKLMFVGEPSSNLTNQYQNRIKFKYSDDIKSGKIKFLGKKSRKQLSEIILEADMFIHAFEGSLDKSIVEATFMGIPVVTINQEYRKIFGTWNNNLAQNELSSELQAYLGCTIETIKKECLRRFEIASDFHSLEHWGISIERVMN